VSGFYIGVDGGGTHTRSVMADAAGRIHGEGKSGSTNRNHHTRDEVRTNMRAALLQASGGQSIGADTTIFLGMCGVSNDADRADIISIVHEIAEVNSAAKIAVDNDAVIGLTGGLSGRPGIVLIAGTGSACMGIDAKNNCYWCGGWGAMADDVGSAPWIGLRAMQAAVRVEDGRIATTLLRDIVFNFLELKHPRELIDRVHNRGLSREELGMLAPHVIAAAASDAIAAAIIRDAITELSLLVATTATRLFQNDPCEMILVGGLALSGAPFQPILIQRIENDTPSIKVRDPEMSPVRGALLKAMMVDGVVHSLSILQLLRERK
jgi:glucosamine kinase